MAWHVLDFDFGGTDTVLVVLVDGNRRIEVMADVELYRRSAVLRGLHIQGAGPNTLGVVALRGLIAWAKEYLDVRIEGALKRVCFWAGIRVAEKFRRNRKITITIRPRVSTMVNFTSLNDSVMVSDRS